MRSIIVLRAILSACLASSLPVLGCDDDSVDPATPDAGSATPETGAPDPVADGGTSDEAQADALAADDAAPDGRGADSAPASHSPVYALTTQVFGETDDQSYVLLAHQLDGDTSLTLEGALVEIAGRALGTGPEGSGALYVASDLAPTITKYNLTDSGQLVGGTSVSFLAKGVTSFGEYGGQFQYIAADKAYWFDGPTAQIVVWNPSTMKITSVIPLPGLATEGQTLTFTAAPIRKGDKMYSFASLRAGLAVTKRVAVVVVDTKTNQAQVLDDARCGYARDGVLANDGMLYVATEAFGSAAYQLNPANPVPCLLRVDTTTDAFDVNFKVDLSTLANGRTTGSLIVGPGNEAFLRVIDPAAVPADVTNPRVLASTAAWGWAALTLGATPSAMALSSAPLSGGSVVPFKLGSRVFAPLFVDGEKTEMVELTSTGPVPGKALSIPGLVFSAVKLR